MDKHVNVLTIKRVLRKFFVVTVVVKRNLTYTDEKTSVMNNSLYPNDIPII